MKKLIRVFSILSVLVAGAVPLDALPPGACYSNRCLMCTITVYADGQESPVSCQSTGSWGYCRCTATVQGECWGEGDCYYHP